jgi:hypothetical protein
MRLNPIYIAIVIIAIAALVYFVTRSGPEPVAYAPPPAELLPPQAKGPLAPETTTRATLAENGTDQWTFDATAGDSITVQLIALSGSLTILPPDDIFPLVQVSVDDVKDTAEICAQPLALTGTYTLQVDGVAPPGTYTVRIERLGPPTDEPLSAVAETLATESSTLMVVRSPPCQDL